MAFQESVKGVSMKYQGCFMQVSWIGSFKGVSRKFQESFNGVLREFQGFFKGVSRVFQRSSEDDSRKFLICLEEISMVFLESFMGVAKSFQCGTLWGVLKVF